MNEENIHQRTFQVRVEFTDEERDQFFERLGLSLDDERSITRAIRDEIASNLEEVGLRPTITMLADSINRRAKTLSRKVVAAEEDAEALRVQLRATGEDRPQRRDRHKSTCDECGAEVGESGLSCPDGAYVCGACFDGGAH